MRGFLRIIAIFLFLVWGGGHCETLAQHYEHIEEKIFLNTRWQFTYASHVGSDEVIFRAEDGYEHFVWFKYNDSCYTYFNGNLETDLWEINLQGTRLTYRFSDIRDWAVAVFNERVLVLEFQLQNQAYRYHFLRVSETETPFFTYAANELPEVEVSRIVQGKDPHPYRFLKNEKGKGFRQPASKMPKSKKEKEDSPQEEQEFLQIELVGGGFSGGPDPVYRNFLVIKTDGRVIRELQTEAGGLRVWKSNISRQHLEELVLYIEKKNFFDMQQLYACSTELCMNRLRDKPRPIALRLALTKGSTRKVVTLSIWEGLGASRRWVNYPPEIDMIIKAIEDVTLMAIGY